jgi:hypothetical protein
MTRKTRQDGIRTLDDLKARCRIDTETGCWVWAGAMGRGTPRVWLPDIGVASMSGALQWVTDATRPTSQRMLIPTCGNPACANPKHRQWGTRSELFALLRPTLAADHRARIGAGKRKASPIYTPELHAEIMTTKEPLADMAARLGVHFTHLYRIRRGKAWAASACASSAFTWRPAA